jgi:hypothetical protein
LLKFHPSPYLIDWAVIVKVAPVPALPLPADLAKGTIAVRVTARPAHILLAELASCGSTGSTVNKGLMLGQFCGSVSIFFVSDNVKFATAPAPGPDFQRGSYLIFLKKYLYLDVTNDLK